MKEKELIRKHLIIQGAVQGVGFRPFIFRLAHEKGLSGWIVNSPAGVELEIQGSSDSVNQFINQLPDQAPPLALIRKMEVEDQAVLSQSVGGPAFVILPSKKGGAIRTLVMPDMATCHECLADIKSPKNRRFRYPFTNCTNCGPRYSIIEKLPYDRPYTSMKHFPMCPDCLEEYKNPLNRRFHAQPNACPACGPQLTLWDEGGGTLETRDDALKRSVDLLKEGAILALKGIGGFQLLADATNSDSVKRLRQRKGRMTKPFAMMAANCSDIEKLLPLSALEKRVLQSPQAPIVLVEKKGTFTPGIAPLVSGKTPTLGFMLPYSPLHFLLMQDFNGILVATSGNLSEEPICIEEHEALIRMKGIADYFLVHNRPIVRPVDDSVVRMVGDNEMLVRRARGFAPFPIEAQGVVPQRLAVGGHLKNTIAISKENSIFVSQHIGDLETLTTRDCFEKTIRDLSIMYEMEPEGFLSDLHPDYFSSHYIYNRRPKTALQHHYAHVLACMADNQLDQNVLGVSWDGTGLGTDGTIWGGEFLICNRKSWNRIGHLRPFWLPGGDKAAREPRRTALSLLMDCYPDQTEFEIPGFSKEERQIVAIMLQRNLNCAKTTSAGRLFDGFASLLHLCQVSGHEGEAPQALELCASLADGYTEMDMGLETIEGAYQLDWRPLVRILYQKRTSWNQHDDVQSHAAGLHHALARGILKVAQLAGQKHICLTGGCFQNRYLAERTQVLLSKEGFQVFLHRQIPPNDGGLSAGQLYFAG